MMHLISAWWHKMTNGIGEDRIIIHYGAKDAIDLEQLSASFSAIARQHRKVWRSQGRKGTPSDVRLYVTKVESGSVEIELAAALFILQQLYTAADYALVFDSLTQRLKSFLGYFARGESRPPELTPSDTSDLGNFIRPLTGRSGASLRVRRARFRSQSDDREVIAEYEFDEPELERAGRNIAKELEGNKELTSGTHRNVLMYWHQTNKDEAREKGKTGDLAVIPTVSHDPLPVLFPSEKASLKREMTDTEKNPFLMAFYVDVSVQYADGEATAYGLLELRNSVPLKETGDDDV